MTESEPYRAPTPDPSTLSTAQVQREIGMLREIIESRLDGMDKALGRAEAYPTAIDGAIRSVREIYDVMFAERKLLADQEATSSKTAIEAAFQAQKEAATKSEAGFTKQIDALTTLLNTKTDGLSKELGELKSTQTSNAGQAKGVSSLWALIAGGVLMLVGVLSLVLPLMRSTPAL